MNHYKYDKLTGEYIGIVSLQKDIRASERLGRVVYCDIPYTTDVEPPELTIKNKTIVFNKDKNIWEYVEDYRGTIVINVKTKEMFKYDKLGPITYPYSLDIPKTTHLKYLEYVSGSWKLKDKQEIVNDIWEIRKQKRDELCASTLLYKGHMIRVDSASFNDILMAAQEAIFENDFIKTKRWVCADSSNVTLTGADFVNIMKLYGERRQQLVYESNEMWKHDLTLSDEELLSLYDELTKI